MKNGKIVVHEPQAEKIKKAFKTITSEPIISKEELALQHAAKLQAFYKKVDEFSRKERERETENLFFQYEENKSRAPLPISNIS